MTSLLKSLPDPPVVSPGGDNLQKGPSVQQSIAPTEQSPSSNTQLPGSPSASPGKKDLSGVPLVQQPVSLNDQNPRSDKEPTSRDPQQGQEAGGGYGQRKKVTFSRSCQVS